MLYTFEIYPLLLALTTAGLAGVVGSFALMKRMSLAGDVMSHVALPGLAIAVLFRVHPLWGGAAALLLGSLLIWQIERRTTVMSDSAIGVVFAAALALGALLLQTQEELIDALFGGFSTVTLSGLILGLLAIGLALIIMYRLRGHLLLGLFSPELAHSSGVRVDRVNLIYFLVFSLTILLGLQFLGAILVGALIIVPAAVGRQLTHTLGNFLIVSALAGMISVGLGFFLSAVYHLALGPTIVVVASVLFGLSLFKKKE
ncbi:MAG: metal ABC transporter permease [Candidatus Liptonbacteria bacterium]|nr:metal ABC transporter permease [Candidatus Liptonbacteria bacterium]